jgi:cytoplasmic iron level regulating protein YaaA (DUF328/UPF0246 family)
MIVLLSPAKKMEFETLPLAVTPSQPIFLEQSEKLIHKLKTFSRKKIADLMSLSPNLADLNFNRYQNWSIPFTPENALPAIYAFRGDVYIGFNADSLSEEEIDFAQHHLRILSGLHGILKPLDLVQPHRLEMGTRLPVARKKNLYDFWKKDVAQTLQKELDIEGSGIIANLASQEYFKVVDTKSLKCRIINFSFFENKGGEFKMISLFAKQARGSMARFIVDHKILDIKQLKSFNKNGYQFLEAKSDESHLCFVR